MRVTSLDSKWETLNFSKRIFNVESGYLLAQRHSSFARIIHMKKYTFQTKHYATLQRWIYVQCRPYFCHRSKHFYAYFKEQKQYQNIIIFDILLLKYNIFRNHFQSLNSNFKKYYCFSIKKQLKKKRFSNYWITINIRGKVYEERKAFPHPFPQINDVTSLMKWGGEGGEEKGRVWGFPTLL